MLHNTFTSGWLSTANKGLQDVFPSKVTWLSAKAFSAGKLGVLAFCTLLRLLTQSAIQITCQIFISSSTVAATTLAPGRFHKGERDTVPAMSYHQSGNT